MKKVILVLMLLATFLFAKCYKVDCKEFIELTKLNNIRIVEQAFESYSQSIDNMAELEDEYLEVLKEQNKILEKLEKLEAENAVAEKNLVLLIKQNSDILGNIIDIETTIEMLELEK